MILGESFASLYFPPGVLPRGCLQIELQTLDFCTSNDPAHKHFAADTKVPYPVAAGNVYQNTITVKKEIPRPLVYAKRRSLFKAALVDIAPPPDDIDPAEAELERRLAEAAADIQAPQILIEDVDELVDGTPDEFDSFLESHQRMRRQAEGAEQVQPQVIAVTYATSTLLKGTPIGFSNTMLIVQLMDVMNGQLEECKKQTGYVWGQYPRFAMSTLTPEEIAAFNLTAEQAKNFRMMVIHVPFGVGIYTGGVSVWIAMGFTEQAIFTTFKERPNRMLKNLNDMSSSTTFRAQVPFKLTAVAVEQYAGIMKAKKKSQAWPDAERSITTSLNFLQPSLSFDMDLNDFNLPFDLECDVYFTRELLRNITEHIRACFHYSTDDFMSIEVQASAFTGIPYLEFNGFRQMSVDSKFRAELDITFSTPEFAAKWGFGRQVVKFKAMPGGPQTIPDTLFTAKPSVYDEGMDVDAKTMLSNDLAEGTNNVKGIAWTGTRGKNIPYWFELLLKLAAEKRAGAEDVGMFVPGRAVAEVQGAVQNVAQQQQDLLNLQAELLAAAAEQQRRQQQPQPPQFMQVQIPNPAVAPPTSFIPWSKPPVGRCAAPGTFPATYFVLLREAEINDYIVHYGHICKWAQKTTAAGNHLTSKKVVLLNTEFERELHIQFLSTDLNLYIHQAAPGAQGVPVDAYIRAGLFVKVLNYIR